MPNKPSNIWCRGTDKFKGWRYRKSPTGATVISPNNKTYRVINLCCEVKTVPETQAGYLWTLRVVYSYVTLTDDKAMSVIEFVYGVAVRQAVTQWTEHLVLIEECGDYVGLKHGGSGLNGTLENMALDRIPNEEENGQ